MDMDLLQNIRHLLGKVSQRDIEEVVSLAVNHYGKLPEPIAWSTDELGKTAGQLLRALDIAKTVESLKKEICDHPNRYLQELNELWEMFGALHRSLPYGANVNYNKFNNAVVNAIKCAKTKEDLI
jgi:hypothetical protein